MLSIASARIPLIIATLGIAGCASLRGQNDLPKTPVQVEIHNDITRPIPFMVYAVKHNGIRTQLGSVPPGTERTFMFTPSTFSESYRLVAVGPSGRQFRSQVFTVGSEMTGHIIWMMSANIVGFQTIEPDPNDTLP